MKWLQSLPIRLLILSLMLLMALPAVGLIIHAGLQDRKADLKEAARTSTYLLNNIASELHNSVDASRQLLEMLALLPEVRQHNSRAVNVLLTDLLQKHPVYTNILIVDRNGMTWAGKTPGNKPLNVADWKAFRDAMASGGFSPGEYIVDEFSRKPALNVAAPLRDSSGRIVGAILCVLNIEPIGTLSKGGSLPPGTSFGIFDHKGVFLFRTLDPGRFVGKQDKQSIFEQMQKGPDEGVFDLISNDGIRRHSAYRKIRLAKGQPPYAYVRGGIPTETSLKQANADLILNLAVMTLVLLLVFAVNLLLSKRLIVERLAKLKAAAEEIAHGNFDIKIAEKVKGGELGVLGQALDDMTQKLAEYVRERHQAAEEYQAIVQTTKDGFNVCDKQGRIIEANSAYSMMLGYSRQELLSKNIAEIDAVENSETVKKHIEKIIATGSDSFQSIHRRKDGSTIDVDVTITYQSGQGGRFFSFVRDISERKQAEVAKLNFEKKLLHSQKLESLGILAGGIAHDFNNILTAIIGNAGLALMKVDPASPVIDNLHRIEQSAGKAADLAKQMLAYSGNGHFVIETVNLNQLLEEMGHMLEVSVSRKALLRYNMAPSLPAIDVDATQIRQVVMNLIINASEAIGEQNGVIAITTGCMDCDMAYLKKAMVDSNAEAGCYVCLEVADNGCGMDKETMSKLFEPFFTTKFTGRGLGMAAVQGIVHGHKGFINFYSEPGKGTTFKVFLPASDKPAENIENQSRKDDWRGEGKVLLVDDEEAVRDIGKEMLKELGLTAITANDGIEAIELFKAHPDIAFVILDLTMPHMDGEQCFNELIQLKPDIKVIMSSGFSEQEVSGKFVGKKLAGFIQKPYTMSVLKEAIRNLAT